MSEQALRRLFEDKYNVGDSIRRKLRVKDYELVLKDLSWKTWCVDVWGYKSISELETRLESYSITLALINEFVEWLKNDRDTLETDMADKKGTYTTMVELSCIEHILMKLKELGLYKEEK